MFYENIIKKSTLKNKKKRKVNLKPILQNVDQLRFLNRISRHHGISC